MNNNEKLMQLHTKLLVIIDEVDRICRKHNIPYFLDSGTALGAIRHKGFIPWDDDADIGFLRKDYLLFLSIAKKELGEAFYLHTFEEDCNFFKFNAKIRLNNTLFPESDSVNMKHRGISVDLFPFDYVPDEYAEAIKMISKARRKYRKIWYARPDTHPTGLKRAVSKFYKMHSYSEMRKDYESYIQSLNETQTITCFVYNLTVEKDLIFKIEDMFPTKQIEFEGKSYSIMRKPDKYLEIMYGDYMKIPTIENQKYHFSGDIIFDIR